MNLHRSDSTRKGWRLTVLGWEIALLACGYSGLFLGVMPLEHRLVITGICFPLAALASWLSGTLTMKEGPRRVAGIVKTTPVLIFLELAL